MTDVEAQTPARAESSATAAQWPVGHSGHGPRRAGRRPQPPAPDRSGAAGLRRRRAAELFQAGTSQAEVARRLGVSRQTAHRWHTIWSGGGAGALEALGRRGPRNRLAADDLDTVAAALRQGPGAHGFPDDRWTCRQVGWVIERLTGVAYHSAHVSRLIRQHGWPVDPPFTGTP